jgi:hypothetical protein
MPEENNERGNAKFLQIVRAGLRNNPARSGDQLWFWIIKATKELGFPIVVALILLLRLPSWIGNAVSGDAALTAEQHRTLVARLQAVERALEVLVSRAEELEASSATVRGMVLGRLKCPEPRCPRCPDLKCPELSPSVKAIDVGPQPFRPVKTREDR